jgi:hypothetical protein
MKILITGIPGTGKTTIGDYLRDNHGFIHFDVEKEKKLLDFEDNTVVSWGFQPNAQCIDLVKDLKLKDFKLIWFDGDRDFFRDVFIERESKNGPQSLQNAIINLNRQMDLIQTSDVINKINPHVIDPSNGKRSFRNLSAIAKDILELA